MNPKNESELNTTVENGTPSNRYYALISSKKPENINERICTNIKQVSQQMKEHKNARFKSFSDLQQALDCLLSVEYTDDDINIETLVNEFERSLYFEPTGRDFNELKRNIETSDYSSFCKKINKNPRFIIDSNDLPPIIQRGFRYNIAHVASMKNRLDILKALFDSIESRTPIERLYPSATDDVITLKIRFLIDHYLNTPEKGNFETPLHFASKFGHEGIISFLATHPKTDKTLQNKQKLTAKEIVCSRCNVSESCKEKISELFNAEFYVAFVNDDELQSPKLISPLRLNSDNGLSPKTKIRGLAGPTSSETAKSLTKMWKEKARTPPQKSIKDIDRSFQQTGRDISTKLNVTWMEYWRFLDCYEDLRSPSGLKMMEEFFVKRLLSVLLSHFVASGTEDSNFEDFQSICSDDSFSSCCSQFSDNIFSYQNHPQLISWGNDANKRIRFCCCGPNEVKKEAVNIYLALSLLNVENMTEFSVEFYSNCFVFTNTQLISELKDLLIGWRQGLDNESCFVYRCKDNFSTVFTQKSVTEIVFCHTNEEIRVHFPSDPSSHQLVLFINCGRDLECQVTHPYIGGDKISSEDMDAYDVLADTVLGECEYPLIYKWRLNIGKFNL